MKIRIIISLFLASNSLALDQKVGEDQELLQRLTTSLHRHEVYVPIHSQKIVEAINQHNESTALDLVILELTKIDSEEMRAEVINNLSHFPILDVSSAKATALYFACQKGYLSVVDLLLKHGADINKRENQYSLTPLMIAAQKQFLNIFTYLLKNKADAKLVLLQEEDIPLNIHDFIKGNEMMKKVLAMHTSTCVIL